MKTYENFSNKDKEQIPIMEFLEPFIKSKFFIEEELEEEFKKYPNNVINECIIGDYIDWDYFELEDKDFPYQFVKSWSESGSGHDEETNYCVGRRNSDGKLFKIWIHDAGFIGPSTLTLCEYAEEVQENKKTITEFS